MANKITSDKYIRNVLFILNSQYNLDISVKIDIKYLRDIAHPHMHTMYSITTWHKEKKVGIDGKKHVCNIPDTVTFNRKLDYALRLTSMLNEVQEC